MSAILPLEEQDEIPSGFTIVGHVGMGVLHFILVMNRFTEIPQAHLNLREQYLPYKYIIASVILDKNPNIRTVINKTSDVGTESVFRTFPYELLAGDPDLNVEVRDEQCTFRFDYSKVYWNSRLNTEHRRLVDKFQPGDAVCDVMAGVGPFAVPAGRKKVFAWANDLNPESYASLDGNIKRNKVCERSIFYVVIFSSLPIFSLSFHISNFLHKLVSSFHLSICPFGTDFQRSPSSSAHSTRTATLSSDHPPASSSIPTFPSI